MISLKQLRYFEALARTGHFGRAAEACGVTQPALSMQMQELERNLGLELVERGTKGVRLTEAGEEIAHRVERILAEVQGLRDFARGGRPPLTGVLRLGVIPSVAPYLLPQVLPVLRTRHPDLELEIRETQTRGLLGELVDGALDLLVLALPADHAEVESMALIEDRFLLAVPRDRKLPVRVRATLDNIARDRLLLLEEGHCLREQALEVCDLRQAGRIDTFGASSLSTIVQMVSNGLGLTLLPELAAEVEARGSGIRLVRFAEPEPRRTIGLVWRKTSPRKRDFFAFGRAVVTAVSARCRCPSPEASAEASCDRSGLARGCPGPRLCPSSRGRRSRS